MRGKVRRWIDMNFSSAILSVVAAVLAGLVALSLISPPGEVRVGLYFYRRAGVPVCLVEGGCKESPR